MNRALLSLAILAALSACGGGHIGSAPNEKAPAPIIDAPMEGYQPDGTLAPPQVTPADPAPEAAPGAVPTAPPAEPCRAPQASEQGIANGKPPVGRCA